MLLFPHLVFKGKESYLLTRYIIKRGFFFFFLVAKNLSCVVFFEVKGLTFYITSVLTLFPKCNQYLLVFVGPELHTVHPAF